MPGTLPPTATRTSRRTPLQVSRGALLCALLLLLAAWLPLASPRGALAFGAQLRRYPYLTDVVGPYAMISWATDRSATTSSVKWGRVGSESCTAHVTAATRIGLVVNSVMEYQWKASLTLTPGTLYCYRIYLGDAPEIDLLGADPSPRFWTQVPQGSSQPFSFAVFGDWGMVDLNGANPDQANVMRQIAASGARFAVTTGDNAYPAGSQTNYGDLVQTGANISAVFGPTFWTVAGSSVPLFPVIGNHGFSSTLINHPHLLNWPQDQAVASSNGRYTRDTYCCSHNTIASSYPSVWYAFDAGNARFYILEAAWDDANVGTASSYQNDYANHWTPSSAQYQWLANDLAAHGSALKFAFFHYPLYSDNSTETSDTFLQGPSSLEGLLNRYGVAMAFSGHAHMYQRNRKTTPTSLVSYITGGGGADVEPIAGTGCSALDGYGIGWSTSVGAGSSCGAAPVPQSVSQVFHFLLVTVNGLQVTVAPTDEQGQTFDVQTYNFGVGGDRQAPSAPSSVKATVMSPTRVNLSWSAATDNQGVAGYVVMRNGLALATLSAGTRSYLDRGVSVGGVYTYTMEAFDAAGNQSNPSNAVQVSIANNTGGISIFLPLMLGVASDGVKN